MSRTAPPPRSPASVSRSSSVRYSVIDRAGPGPLRTATGPVRTGPGPARHEPGGRPVADGPHGRLLLADALSVGKQGERTLVLVRQSERHSHKLICLLYTSPSPRD